MTAFVVGLALLFGPPSPVVHTPDDQVTAGRGSYCWAGDSAANALQPYVCADAPESPTSERALSVHAGGSLEVDVLTDTDSLTATLRGRDGELSVEAVGDSRRRFVVWLPLHMSPEATLDLHARYPRGDASFAVLLATPPPPAPPKPLLRAGHGRLVMARGSYCWHTPPLGLCVDARPPLTADALAVRRGGVVRGDLRLGADVIGASIAGRPPDLRVQRVHGSKRRFAFRLPTYPDDRLVLRLFVRYPEGDASFGARLRVSP